MQAEESFLGIPKEAGFSSRTDVIGEANFMFCPLLTPPAWLSHRWKEAVFGDNAIPKWFRPRRF
jgi:hypothetical protein